MAIVETGEFVEQHNDNSGGQVIVETAQQQ